MIDRDCADRPSRSSTSTDFSFLVLPCHRRYFAVDEFYPVRVFAAYSEWTTQFDWCGYGLDAQYDSVYCLWSWTWALGTRWPWKHLVLILYFVVVSARMQCGAVFYSKHTTCESCMLWLWGHVCSCCRVDSTLLLYCSMHVWSFRQVVCVWSNAKTHHCAGRSWIGPPLPFLPLHIF